MSQNRDLRTGEYVTFTGSCAFQIDTGHQTPAPVLSHCAVLPFHIVASRNHVPAISELV